MKSIYDEALKEISEQKEAWGVYIRSIVPTQLDMITKALKQAQKQEKLLNLYKELSIKERKRATSLKTRNVDKYNQLNKEIEIINEQIKELENEME